MIVVNRFHERLAKQAAEKANQPPPAAAETALDRPLIVTFFSDAYAANKTERVMSLRELVDLLNSTTAPTKAALPWLKLAAFGTARTKANSLRHDENVLEISGIEADYDGETITLDRARTILQDAGIAAVLYTSPSHTEAKPRWRVLCPTSVALPPAIRAALVARVNGLFVGALARESFTLSQAYYFGSVAGSASHQVIFVEGKAIDLASELDAAAHFQAPRPAPQSSRPWRRPDHISAPRYESAALRMACEAIMGAPDGGKHDLIVKEAYSIGGLVSGGDLPEAAAFAQLSDALAAIAHRCKNFRAAQTALRRSFDDGMGKPRDVPHEPPAEAEHPAQPYLDKLYASEAKRQAKPLPVAPELMDVPGALGLFVAHCERTAISPQPFLALAAGISLIGTLAGRKYRTATDLRTNLYSVGVADSGAGKDHARKRIKACLADAGLTKYLGGEKIASGQAMFTALERHPCCLFQIDEFGDFLADVLSTKASAHRRDISANLKTLYSSAATFVGGTEYADAKARPKLDIQQPHACLYATTTPGQLWNAIAGRSLHDGLMARVLLFVSPCSYPDEGSPVHELVPADLTQALKQIDAGAADRTTGEVGNLAALMIAGTAAEPFTARNAPEAERAYAALRREQIARQRQHEGTYVTAIVGRLAENAMKLALVRAVSRNPAYPEISGADVAWGRALALHCIETLLREAEQHVSESEVEARLKHILGIIRKHGPVTDSQLLRRGADRFSERDRKEAIDTLERSGRITRTNVPTTAKGGRPTIRYSAVNLGAETSETDD